MEIKGASKALIKKYAEDFLKNLEPRSKGAVVVGLYGDLGAGKTFFTQIMANLLGIKEKVLSPTFVLEKIYNIPLYKFKRLYHIDAYRFEGEEEVLKIGWEEIIKDRENLIFLEWPEKIGSFMPKDHIKIEFGHSSEDTRDIKTTWPQNLHERR